MESGGIRWNLPWDRSELKMSNNVVDRIEDAKKKGEDDKGEGGGGQPYWDRRRRKQKNKWQIVCKAPLNVTSTRNMLCYLFAAPEFNFKLELFCFVVSFLWLGFALIYMFPLGGDSGSFYYSSVSCTFLGYIFWLVSCCVIFVPGALAFHLLLFLIKKIKHVSCEFLCSFTTRYLVLFIFWFLGFTVRPPNLSQGYLSREKCQDGHFVFY